MPLLGKAAMLLAFDMAPEALADFDAWYTREHFPERLGIPGFLRGTRWSAVSGAPRFFAMYEVRDIGVLASQPYLERLNSPTPWTTKMMAHFRGMTRGFCNLTAEAGTGLGLNALLLRFAPAEGADAALRTQLAAQLAQLAARPGIISAQLFESGAKPAQTSEQRLRGADAGVDWAVLVSGYDPQALAQLAAGELAPAKLESAGARGVVSATYRMDYALLAAELAAPR